MSPLALIPSPDSLPVPWGWFEALLLITFAGHLLLMNMLLGGGFFLLFGGKAARPIRHLVTHRLPAGLALTVNMGVPPLLFLQVLYGQFLYTSSVLSAVYWLSTVGLTMLAYALLYIQISRDERHENASSMPLAVGMVALVLVSLVMTNVMTLMERPDAWTAYFSNASGTISNLTDPTFAPRWLHFMLASVAVGGLAVAFWAHRLGSLDADDAMRVTRLGLKWFTHTSLLQIVIGGWWLMALPREAMLQFMGGSTLATTVFVVALGAAALSILMGFQGRIVAAAWGVGLTIALMVCVRALARVAVLGPYYQPDTFVVTGQYSPMVLFAVSLVFGVVAIVYMLRLYRKAGGGL